MAKCINVDLLLEQLDDKLLETNPEGVEQIGLLLARQIIREQPAMGTTNHGEWKINCDGYFPYCSKCGNEPKNGVMTDFCPSCGAKMNSEKNSRHWILTAEQKPPENVVIDTKIDDEKGVRNKAQLIYHDNLWWFPDNSMYVYYTPTHWRLCLKNDNNNQSEQEGRDKEWCQKNI